MGNPVAIVQARMGSERLPGKVLLPLADRPVLWHVITRLRQAHRLEGIVVATTDKRKDDPIADFCDLERVPCYRGSEEDVLDRYYRAAKRYRADPIVRITADCPVIDPTIVDCIVAGHADGGYDVYGLAGEFPDGLDCTAYSFQALERAWKSARLPSEREHVGPYMSKHPELFKLGGYEPFRGLKHHRWTLDEEADYRFLSRIFARLYKDGGIFSTPDILALLKGEPELLSINQGIVRNEGYLKSLACDQEPKNTPERS